jgi:hypothetical protein
MSVRKGLALLVALSALLFLAACGSSNGPATPVAPPTGGFSNSNLNGTYVFSVSGYDSGGSPYAMVGTFTFNGSGGNNQGNVTAGSLDINDESGGQVPAATISGTYSVGIDGRGQAEVTSNIPNLGSLAFDFVLSSSSHGLITEFDTFGSGSGTLDAQTAGVTPSGSYAFSLAGASGNSSWATAGNFTVSGTSISGLDDFNNGVLSYPAQALSGSLVVGPSSSPSTTLDTAAFSGLFDVYAIDATHLKFIEMDPTATLSGDAFSQPSTTISAGTMAFTLAGSEFAAGGYMVTDGNGNITNSSTEDYNAGGNFSTTSGSFSATYTAGGTGRYTLGNFQTFAGGTEYAAYPSSGGLLLLEIDGSGVTVGAAYPQTSPIPAFAATSQGYGLNLSGIFLGSQVVSASEVDDIAEFTASAASGGAGTLTAGIVDENYAPGGSPIFALALSQGTYGSLDSLGRYGLAAAAGNSTTSTLNGGFTLTFYSVDGTTFPFIESDPGQVATGVMVQQNPSAAVGGIAKPAMFVVRPLIKPHGAFKKKQK